MNTATNTADEFVSLDQIHGNQPYEFKRVLEVNTTPKQTTKPYVRYTVPHRVKQAVNDPKNDNEQVQD